MKLKHVKATNIKISGYISIRKYYAEYRPSSL